MMEKILFNFEVKIWQSVKNFEQILITGKFFCKILNLNKTLNTWTIFEYILREISKYLLFEFF